MQSSCPGSRDLNMSGKGLMSVVDASRAVFTHGPKGPGPRVANFQGRHIKKKIIEIEVWYVGKKGCPQERNLREIYTENTIMFCLLSVFCVFCLHITEYEQIRGGAKFSWAQGMPVSCS
jgi:hypothetical protein